VVLLADQDRALWDHDQIALGRASLARAHALHGRGPYALQAAIASLHTAQTRDWTRIAELYGELAALTGSPVIELNRAVALAESGRVHAALGLVETLELDGYHYLHSTRAELLRRLDRVEDARAAYTRALELAHAEPERRFLQRRLVELGPG
jgi:RNA polymerase sigma-70 factor (ECF subfamily)